MLMAVMTLLDHEYARRWCGNGDGDHVLRGRHELCMSGMLKAIANPDMSIPHR